MNKGLRGLVTLAIAGMSSVVMAAGGIATLPYQMDFESLALGSSITSVPNWSSSSAITTITNVTYVDTAKMNTPYMGTPLSNGHARVMSFSDAPVTNSYDGLNCPIVAIDTMIQPTISQELVSNAAVSNSQFSISFVTNGVAIWHGLQTTSAYGSDSNNWFVINNGATPVSSGKWVRLTVTINYQADPDGFGLFNALFQVKIDGQPLISAQGHSTDSMSAPTPGSWHLMAQATTPTQINSLTLDGSGMLDDLAVTTNLVDDSITTAYSVPFRWLQLYSLTNDTGTSAMNTAAGLDSDSDGMANWQEYLAGTDPTNSASQLIILSQTVINGIPTIQWQSSSKAVAPYRIAMASNIASNNWTTITSNVARVDGTTTVIAPHTTNSPAYYRVQVAP